MGNGGLDKINIFYWGAVLGAAAAIELRGATLSESDKADGNFQFDPLNFMQDKSAEDKAVMQRKELKNGRLAMMAILGFAVQEAVQGKSVFENAPQFFEPIWDVLIK